MAGRIEVKQTQHIELEKRTHHGGMTRQCDAIVGKVATISRRVSCVTSAHDASQVVVVAWITKRLNTCIGDEAASGTSSIVSRRVVGASKAMPAAPGHAMSRADVFFFKPHAVADVGSGSVRISVVEAHVVDVEELGLSERNSYL